jgi:predicted aspartyl protease
MVYGYFQQDIDLPYVEVAIFSGKQIIVQPVVLDTGFSGELKISQNTADKFGIEGLNPGKIATPYGQIIPAQYTDLFVELEGKKILARTFIIAGPSLIGIKLLDKFGYKAVVDARNRTAHLERVI